MDFYDAFGFIYFDADERTAPDEKEDEVSSYAEEAGEHRDGRTVDAPFDYTASFLVEAPNRDLTNVNAKIAAFNAAIRETTQGSDVKRKREIAFYNLDKRVKITGYPELIAEPKECYRTKRAGEMECAKVELKIRVSDPRKCEWNLGTGITRSGNDLIMTVDYATSDVFIERWGRKRNTRKVPQEGPIPPKHSSPKPRWGWGGDMFGRNLGINATLQYINGRACIRLENAAVALPEYFLKEYKSGMKVCLNGISKKLMAAGDRAFVRLRMRCGEGAWVPLTIRYTAIAGDDGAMTVVSQIE